MRQVETTIDIQCPAPDVIRAFMEQSQLKEWWQVENSFIEPQTGGLYTLLWNISATGFGYVSSGLIQDYDPQGLLSLHKMIYLNPEKQPLGPMQLLVRATPHDQDSCSLYLCQSGYQQGGDWDWYYQAVKEAWPKMAGVLKDYLEDH